MWWAASAVPAASEPAPRIEIAGDWRVRVTPGTLRVGRRTIRVTRECLLDAQPPALARVRDERIDALPAYNAAAPGWTRGARLRAVVTSETTGPGLLDPSSLRVKSGPGEAPELVKGRDFEADTTWGTIGGLAGGAVGRTVWVDYDAGLHRIDSVLVTNSGEVRLRRGQPHNATPRAPEPAPGETLLGNIWVAARIPRLTPDHLYPIVETGARQRPAGRAVAERLLPMTWRKLQAGEEVHVLAWGDSVTAGGEASDEAHRWQNRFVTLLARRFPRARIRLTTAGWGGRNSDSFLNEPPGAEFNFERAVLEPRPDLVAMEFVNDAWMTPDVVEERYSKLLARFREIGAEWVILTPHYVWPEWMGVKTARIEEDPRPYVKGVREFCARHSVALADASREWGRLARRGIPYPTLLVNSLNHPDDRGHEIFAQTLMDLFGGAR